MSYINSFKVNLKKCEQNIATHYLDGLMSKEDKIILDSLTEANIQGGDISNVTLTGPTVEELIPEFETINETINVHTNKLDNFEETLKYVSPIYCGRVWDESNSTPVAKTYCGDLNMLRNLPELLGLGGYLVQNDHTRRKLSKENHYFFENGEEAKLDGTMGHYQWGWNKPFYITTWKDGDLFYECISFQPLYGKDAYYVPVGSISAAGFAALDAETNTLVSYINTDKRYRNSHAEWDNDSVRSQCGRAVVYKTAKDYMSYARNNGSGWYSANIRTFNVIKVLYHIIMGTRNSHSPVIFQKDSNGLYQGGTGVGVVTNEDYSFWNYWASFYKNYPILGLNVGVELGNYTGETDAIPVEYVVNSETKIHNVHVPIFFGLKNFYSYIWRNLEDAFGYIDSSLNNKCYIRKSLLSDNYEYGTVNDSVYEINLPNPGLIKELNYNNFFLTPYLIDNSSTNEIYYSDIFYADNPQANQYRSILINGSMHINVGIHFFNLVQYGIDYAYSFVGTSLCEFTEDFLLEPVKLI